MGLPIRRKYFFSLALKIQTEKEPEILVIAIAESSERNKPSKWLREIRENENEITNRGCEPRHGQRNHKKSTEDFSARGCATTPG
jgi:hypothetical protein